MWHCHKYTRIIKRYKLSTVVLSEVGLEIIWRLCKGKILNNLEDPRFNFYFMEKVRNRGCVVNMLRCRKCKKIAFLVIPLPNKPLQAKYRELTQ